MKSTYRRIFTAFTVFCVVFMILVSSMVVPAKAAHSIQPLNLWSYYIGSESIDDDVILKFELGGIPTQYLFVNAATNDSSKGSGSLTVSIPHESYVYNLYAWPLGTANWYNQSADSGLIDLADFSSFIQFSLESYYEIDIKCSTEIWAESRTFPFQAYYQVQYYDDEGGYLGYHQSPTETRNPSINNGITSFNFNFQSTLYLQPPDAASYFCFFVKMIFPSNFSDDGWLHEISVSSDRLRINCTVDSLTQDVISSIRNGQKLDGINDQLGDLNDKSDQTNQQLGDLNDKTDTLISGTPELQDQADNFLNDSQDLNDQINDAIAQLEDIEDFHDELYYVDDYGDRVYYTDELGFQGVIDHISLFLDEAPWNDMTSLVAPIMEFPPVVTILTVLIAFINISILFFGR